jgi:threonine dehydratase
MSTQFSISPFINVLFRIEILEDCPEVDCVLVPVGGGGLMGGIARYIKQVRPSVEVRHIYTFY